MFADQRSDLCRCGVQCYTTTLTCGGTVQGPLIGGLQSAHRRVKSEVFPPGQTPGDTQALTFTP